MYCCYLQVQGLTSRRHTHTHTHTMKATNRAQCTRSCQVQCQNKSMFNHGTRRLSKKKDIQKHTQWERKKEKEKEKEKERERARAREREREKQRRGRGVVIARAIARMRAQRHYQNAGMHMGGQTFSDHHQTMRQHMRARTPPTYPRAHNYAARMHTILRRAALPSLSRKRSGTKYNKCLHAIHDVPRSPTTARLAPAGHNQDPEGVFATPTLFDAVIPGTAGYCAPTKTCQANFLSTPIRLPPVAHVVVSAPSPPHTPSHRSPARKDGMKRRLAGCILPPILARLETGIVRMPCHKAAMFAVSSLENQKFCCALAID